jgi:ribonuclease T1
VKIAFYVGLLLLVGWLYASDQADIKPAGQPNSRQPTKSSNNPAESPSPEIDRSSRQRNLPRPPQRSEPQAHVAEADGAAERADHPETGLVVHKARVTNEDGDVIYRGDIDLQPTLDRIERGKRLRFSHDGIVFENRERRLPQKPTGYYYEFVHPTPGDNGPGGQRVVVGREGEIYYSPDHYHTFRRVK